MEKCMCWCLSIIELKNARWNIEIFVFTFTRLSLSPSRLPYSIIFIIISFYHLACFFSIHLFHLTPPPLSDHLTSLYQPTHYDCMACILDEGKKKILHKESYWPFGMTSYNLVDTYGRFRGTCCPHSQVISILNVCNKRLEAVMYRHNLYPILFVVRMPT